MPTERLLPQAYYAVRNPRQLLWWFRTFRVELFRKFLLVTLWRNKQKGKEYFDGTTGVILTIKYMNWSDYPEEYLISVDH